MDSLIANPAHWRLSTLQSLDFSQLHELACFSVGTLTTYRLVLGRVLLVMQQSKAFKRFGCSNSTHYATSKLGVRAREARTCRLVAKRLMNLPDLTLAAERGTIAWSKLREIVSKATPETEALWLKLAAKYDADQIQKLVAKTPFGSVPGEAFPEEESPTSELRCALSEEGFSMLDRARRAYSLEREEAVTTAQVLEWALASYLAQQPASAETLDRMKTEADKDLQAERARQMPIVEEAREMAAEMGLLVEPADAESTTEQENDDAEQLSTQDLLAQAVGLVNDYNQKSSATQTNSKRKPPKGFRLGNHRLRFNPQARGTTKSQKRELLRRDGWCCSTPGCPNKVWLHLHHLVPYAQGGETDPDNLISLCTGCHANVHAGYLVISIEHHRPVFRNAQGERIDKQADLELASWLDFHFGWRGKEYESHFARAMGDQWAVFWGDWISRSQVPALLASEPQSPDSNL